MAYDEFLAERLRNSLHDNQSSFEKKKNVWRRLFYDRR